MQIRVLQLLAGAQEATGLVVVIDVFRAFSLACYAFANGADEILAVSDLEAAYRLKHEHPDRILLGERNGAPPPGFDFGNSPAEIEQADFSGRTVIHTTSAGTQGLVNVSGADETITGAFVNAGAIVDYVRKKNPAVLSLVCMGREAIEPTEEDTLCAEFIRDSLRGIPTVFETIRHRLRGSQTARKFFDP